MACNCNEVRTIILNNLCDCNNGNNGAGSGNEGEAPKKKYLDQDGAKFLMQLLKVAFEESPSMIDHVTAAGNSITLHYKDGSKQEIVLDGLREALDQIQDLKDSPASLLDGLTAEEMLKFCKLIIQLGGGLGVDDNGQIYVDFDSMPTDKFEKLMKQIKVPIWVTGHAAPEVIHNADGTYTVKSGGYGDWYVDGDHPNASDTDFDSIPLAALRGQTKDMPFKTINACVKYIAENFNIGSQWVYINIDGGTYNESVTLPQQNRTNGRMVLRPYDNSQTVLITTSGTDGVTVFCAYGAYTLNNLTIQRIGLGELGRHYDCRAIHCADYANLSLNNCSVQNSGRVASSTLDGEDMRTWCIYIDGYGKVDVGTSCTFSVTKGTVQSASMFYLAGSAGLTFASGNDSTAERTHYFNGNGDTLIYIGQASVFWRETAQKYKPTFVNNVTGTKYNISSGGMAISYADVAVGTIDGTVDAATYGILT